MLLTHGGDWAGFTMEYGRAPLDFSANVSPLGLPAGVSAASAEALAAADRYPDPLCRELRSALSAFHGVAAERIVCGNGAADLIWRLCQCLRPRHAAVFVPGFGEYALALNAVDCAVKEIPLPEDAGFSLTAECLARVPEDCELLFLCNPNNPTGRLAAREQLLFLLALCRERGTVLAVDECFLDFCEKAEARTLIPALEEYPGLLILRAFTKTYAMAGLRLGYALCGSETLAARLQGCGQPWAVSSVAQAAGIAALQEKDYVNQLRAMIRTERQRMLKDLSALGLSLIPGEANFLLFHSAEKDLAQKLRRRGILIRDCADFSGLSRGWYRVAIRKPEENSALIHAIREALYG